MSDYWGYHLILNCSGADHASITSYDTIYSFTKALVADIDMVAYGEPQIVNFGSGDKAGYTLIQLIETSNIAAHFVNEFDEIYLDVFSCKAFSEQVVIELVEKFFKIKDFNSSFILRKSPLTLDCAGDSCNL